MVKLQHNLLDILSTKQDTKNNLALFKDIEFMCEYGALKCLNKDKQCFNHLIGLPKKDSEAKPLYQWQYEYIISQLEEHKYNFIKKASGIGATELILRWILYKCLVNNEWSNGIVCYVTGPNIDLSKRLIERTYNLIYEWFPSAKKNDYKLTVGDNIEISAFPSNHVEAFRSLVNVRYILLDEADFFHKGEQDEARITSERYIAKSDVRIAMVSTPNLPGGLFERIELEQPSIYNKIFLPYTIGLETIFSQKQIAEQKKSSSFDREYNLKYLGLIGTIFNLDEVQACITNYSLDETVNTSPYYSHYIGVDPGYGKDSHFAITVLMWINNEMRVVYHSSTKNPMYKDMVHLINQLIQRYQACKVFIDSSGSNLCHELIHTHGEYQAFERLKPELLDRFRYTECGSPLVVPIPFNKQGNEIMRITQSCVSKKLLKVHPNFEEVIISLKSAINKGDNPYSLDKNRSAHHDSLDSLRLALSCMKSNENN